MMKKHDKKQVRGLRTRLAEAEAAVEEARGALGREQAAAVAARGEVEGMREEAGKRRAQVN